MNFRIADTFTASLARLTGDDKKATPDHAQGQNRCRRLGHAPQ